MQRSYFTRLIGWRRKTLLTSDYKRARRPLSPSVETAILENSMSLINERVLSAPFKMRELLRASILTLLLATLILLPQRAAAQAGHTEAESGASGQANAQNGKCAISGHVTDVAGGILQGASVKVQPGGVSAVSDGQGQFTISNLPAGTYTIAISYSGFSVFTSTVNLTAGQTKSTDAVLQVAPSNQAIDVHADLHGEAEQIQVQKTSEDIVNVLSADVITSLPNANIADAVGRLPGVTLERDEGEGKYGTSARDRAALDQRHDRRHQRCIA